MFTTIAQKTTTTLSAATHTSRIIERKKGRASSLIIVRAEPAKPKLKKAVSLFFVRNENFWTCAIETNARDFLSLSLSLSIKTGGFYGWWWRCERLLRRRGD